jgi:hypothetical protein
MADQLVPDIWRVVISLLDTLKDRRAVRLVCHGLRAAEQSLRGPAYWEHLAPLPRKSTRHHIPSHAGALVWPHVGQFAMVHGRRF